MDKNHSGKTVPAGEYRPRKHVGPEAAIQIGILVLFSSALRLNFVLAGFRISPSVIFFPVLLITLGLRVPVLIAGVCTSCVVFLGRAVVELIEGGGIAETLMLLPGALYYLIYCALFGILVRDRKRVPLNVLFFATAGCDFCSNIAELMLRVIQGHTALPRTEVYFQLAAIALMRSVVAVILVFLTRLYHTYLSREEHEARYRRLVMLTSSLRNETYLMRKNSNRIESVMKEAYSLYEDLETSGIPETLRSRALRITSEVHDIKKDYLRIIQGIEQEVDEEIAASRTAEGMMLSDILSILAETEEDICREKELDIAFVTETNGNIIVHAHYALMSALHNLTGNAVEAIAAAKRKGTVSIRGRTENGALVCTVEDNGIGIPERHLSRIFEMGYSTKFDGKTGNIYRGVGLSGVKEIVENQLGGRVTVASREGAGTTFTLTIPLESLEKDGADHSTGAMTAR